MKSAFIISAILVFLLVLGIVIAALPNRTNSPDTNALGTVTHVEASGGKFNPNDFAFNQRENAVVSITALDRDYQLELASLGINATIPRGKTFDILIAELGVGSHKYSCGENCSGTITIIAELDEDEDEY